ncbi:MAG TPA: T9SS type A sorting domain-containing protein [Bacteroidia bacterium]|nr:T9SS type A sorting domain-containing protein [Bacteroidia bacterium]
MKKFFFFASALVLISSLSAQEIIRNANGSYYRQCTSFSESRPLRDLAKEFPAPKPDGSTRLTGDNESHERMAAKRQYDPNAEPVVDPIIQNTYGPMTAPAPIENFDGQQSSQGYLPLDDNGMVGPNDFVQTVNSDYQVFSKTGSALTTSALLSALFPGSGDQGDPVTIYDKFADRWIIEEFDGSCYCTMMFAVSKTSDPTGAYYIYKFTPDASDFADYPKYTVWADGYYQTCNCQNDKVVVYERAKMLVGDPTAGFISIPWTNPNTGGGFYCPMTLNADGALPPYGSPNFLFYYTSASWGSPWKDQIVIDKITANWTAKTGSWAAYQTLNTTAVNDVFNASIDQKGATGSLDPLDGFFSYRIPYMRWGTYNSAVMVSTVNTSTTKSVAGLRWYELRQDTTTKQWSIYQSSTYAPADGLSRWNASIAMNNNGDIAMGFTASSSTAYTSVRYTGRKSCDALNTMTVAEQTAVTSTSSDLSGSGRWGDYSNTSVDPTDGVTFWSTNMYVKSGTQSTRIVSYQVPTCVSTGIDNVTENQATLKAYQSGSQLNIVGTMLPSDDRVSIDIYDIDGKHIAGHSMVPLSNTIETSIEVSSLAKGMYFVRLGNDSYQRVVKVVIQ